MNRGVNKADVFKSNTDKDSFLQILNRHAIVHKAIVHDYALMDNHFHLLLETSKENLSELMRVVTANYTQYFNKKHKRVGHLWQDRYKSKYVLGDDYLYALIKYIEYNPVEAKLSNKVGDYPYTLASSIFKGNSVHHCCKQSQLLNEFDIETLNEFLSVKLSNEELGRIKAKEKVKKVSGELVYVQTKEFKEHFSNIDTKIKRDKAITAAYGDGYRQSEIASHLKISRSTVSKIVKRDFITPGVK